MDDRRILTGGSYTVVTTLTAAGNALMTKRCRNKSVTRDMTDAAIFQGRNVGSRLAGGNSAVMAC